MELHERLCLCAKEKNWETLTDFLKPKQFPKDESGKLVDTKLLAKVAQITTDPSFEVPEKAKVILLKCLVNSCICAYKHKSYDIRDAKVSKYQTELYALLSQSPISVSTLKIDKTYPVETHFPYDGVSQLAVDTVLQFSKEEKKLSDEELDILRQNVQFLSNLVTFACRNISFPDYEEPPKCIENEEFKNAISKLIGHEHIPVVRAASAFVHNMISQSIKDYFSNSDKSQLVKLLINAAKKGIQSASDVTLFLVQEKNLLPNIYNDLQIHEKLYLLEMIHLNLLESNQCFPVETAKFLADKFKKKSDLVLKTVDTYLDGMEPMEVTILLDILGILTSGDDEVSLILRGDKSLLINGLFLLKSLHMAGKESNNFFTPLQKLSEVAPCNLGQDILLKEAENSKEGEKLPYNKNIQAHPAFGFKAGLIRLVGNMAFENKDNQDLVEK
ncbi:ataxin-10 isoform X2 [Belonocnema kinseyi]|uniref:ataxin-10 isoform X2 n=1 Tax=Belonocnema kinseyi TaxID=2817044 RepID=UPI00143E04F2|nr:ataxin-10 isoform X2 [Belonocnema kinseyi]